MTGTPCASFGPDITERARDTSRAVMLVGFLDQGNLGLGYLIAVLRDFGYRVVVVDVENEPDEILAVARRERPLLIGFSLIFQFYITRYERLIRHLRRGGMACHFTMGGHFPSLSAAETMRAVPMLDSVVRFEGEVTLLEVCDRISAGDDWRETSGLVFRRGDELVETDARHLLRRLDDLPYPARDFEPETVLGRRAMPLIASRGCARTCSFCSIHTFYRAASGKIVRTREPSAVVEEMRYLHNERGISIFLFQDDDFPLFGPVWQRWTRNFLAELRKAGLPGNAIWKMNCRADAVDEQLFTEMRDAGLYLVYMGLESGDEDGLKALDKGITVEQNLAAVATLKRVGLVFEFGFMLFDPSSSFGSVRANTRFLRRIAGDGSVAAVFCRMLPYDGTPIKHTLEAEHRLKGDVTNPDYDFLDPRLDDFYAELNQLMHVSGWIHGHKALSPGINWAWNEIAILKRLFPGLAGMVGYQADLRRLTANSNDMLLGVVEDLADHYSGGPRPAWTAAEITERAEAFGATLVSQRNTFIGNNADALMRTLRADSARRTQGAA